MASNLLTWLIDGQPFLFGTHAIFWVLGGGEKMVKGGFYVYRSDLAEPLAFPVDPIVCCDIT